MQTKNVQVESEPVTVPENKKDEGEQKPPLRTVTTEVESPVEEPQNKVSGWRKKLLGIPVWGWVVIAGCLVFAGILFGIVIAVH